MFQFLFKIDTGELLQLSEGSIVETPPGTILRTYNMKELSKYLNINSRAELLNSPYKDYIRLNPDLMTLEWEKSLDSIIVQEMKTELILQIESLVDSIREIHMWVDNEEVIVLTSEYSELVKLNSLNFTTTQVRFKYFNRRVTKSYISALYEIMTSQFQVFEKYKQSLMEAVDRANTPEELRDIQLRIQH